MMVSNSMTWFGEENTLDQTLRGAVDALAESLCTAKPLFLVEFNGYGEWQMNWQISLLFQILGEWM